MFIYQRVHTCGTSKNFIKPLLPARILWNFEAQISIVMKVYESVSVLKRQINELPEGKWGAKTIGFSDVRKTKQWTGHLFIKLFQDPSSQVFSTGAGVWTMVFPRIIHIGFDPSKICADRTVTWPCYGISSHAWNVLESWISKTRSHFQHLSGHPLRKPRGLHSTYQCWINLVTHSKPHSKIEKWESWKYTVQFIYHFIYNMLETLFLASFFGGCFANQTVQW